MTCIRCGANEASQPQGYCVACFVHTRVEVVDGLRRFDAYLNAWAAFADWLEAHPPEAA